MKSKPTRTWHIYFTLVVAIVYVITIYFGRLANRNPLLLFMVLWLFTGIMICVFMNLSEPMLVNIKIILFWLPAIWSSRVRDWVMER